MGTGRGLVAPVIPAYLEATGSRNRRLYSRYGYEPLFPYEITPGGPQLVSMWRNPDITPPPAKRRRFTRLTTDQNGLLNDPPS